MSKKMENKANRMESRKLDGKKICQFAAALCAVIWLGTGNVWASDLNADNESSGVLVRSSQRIVIKKGWLCEDGQWKYYRGGQPVTGWDNSIDAGYWYYFKPDTFMACNSFEIIDGNVYHFNESGHMDTGWQFLPRPADGTMCWYYFNESSGAMTGGWAQLGGYFYYFQPDGTMTCNKLETIDGVQYYFDTDGHMVSN